MGLATASVSLRNIFQVLGGSGTLIARNGAQSFTL